MTIAEDLKGAGDVADSGLKLYTYKLPPGDVPSMYVGSGYVPPGTSLKKAPGSGNALHIDPRQWIGRGYDGVHFVYDQPSQKIIPRNGEEYAVQIESTAGHVRFTGVDICSGTTGNVFVCTDGYATEGVYPGVRQTTLALDYCRLSPRLDGGLSKWGVMGYQANMLVTNTEVHLPRTVEHAFYAHGFGVDGRYLFTNNKMTAVGSQFVKAVHRPHTQTWKDQYAGYVPPLQDIERGTPYAPNTLVWVDRNFITNWGTQNHPNGDGRGGGGIILEGCGAQAIQIMRNTIVSGADWGIPIGIDADSKWVQAEPATIDPNGDGWYGRYFEHDTGVPGKLNPNGEIRIQYNYIDQVAVDSHPAFRILYADALWLESNGIYNAGKENNVTGVTAVTQSGNNTAGINSKVEEVGISDNWNATQQTNYVGQAGLTSMNAEYSF